MNNERHGVDFFIARTGFFWRQHDICHNWLTLIIHTLHRPIKNYDKYKQDKDKCGRINHYKNFHCFVVKTNTLYICVQLSKRLEISEKKWFYTFYKLHFECFNTIYCGLACASTIFTSFSHVIWK